MNTDQRKLLRNGCYFFAGAAALAGIAAFDSYGGQSALELVGAIVLFISGKFIWAGRSTEDSKNLRPELTESQGREKP